MKRVFSGWLLVVWLYGLFSGTAGLAEEKTAVDTEGKHVVGWTIAISGAPNDVSAFGFDVLYPVDSLTYRKIDKGSLIKEGFSYFGANEIAPGKVRVGGMEPGKNIIPKGAKGELATLTFLAKDGEKDARPVFKIIDIKDDMHGWPVLVDGKKPKAVLTIVPAKN